MEYYDFGTNIQNSVNMEGNKKETRSWGGKREGSGRKKKDSEPRVNITFSVPEGIAPRIRELVRDEIARYRSERDGKP